MMAFHTLIDGLKGFNVAALQIALRRPARVRGYISYCMRKFDEIMGRGLPARDPIAFINGDSGSSSSSAAEIVLPLTADADGSISMSELCILALVTKVLKPKAVFEFGTYKGRTTSMFILNVDHGASVTSLDLPQEAGLSEAQRREYIDTDAALVEHRHPAEFIYRLHLDTRCQLLACSSLDFDPSPYAGTIELGFIDGAHALPFVQNDTRKMATMMASRGLVFWHDYGGKGRFQPLAGYLEQLSQRIPIYRISGTSLAWTSADHLRRAFNLITDPEVRVAELRVG